MSLDTALAFWLYTLVLCMIVLMIIALTSLVDNWAINRRTKRNTDD